MATGETDFYARVDMAERIAVLIERQAAIYGDAPITDAELALAADLFAQDDIPEPPTPAAPNVVPFHPRRPFDRATHCQAIAAGGGARTVALYGVTHMRTIGKAGARATIAAHGVGYWQGLVAAKGWSGPREPDLAVDLDIGACLADAA